MQQSPSHRNQVLKQFQEMTDKLGNLIAFEQMKQLNLKDSEQYLKILREVYDYENGRKIRAKVDEDRRKRDLEKLKDNIQRTEYRIRAIHILNNQFQFPEQEQGIIYYLNLQELKQLINPEDPSFNNANQYKKSIQQYCSLQQKIESNDYTFSSAELDFLSIQCLEDLKKNSNNDQTIIVLIEQELNRRTALANYENFIKNNTLQYKLTRDQFTLISKEFQLRYQKELLKLAAVAEVKEPYMEAVYQIHEKLDYKIVDDIIVYEFPLDADRQFGLNSPIYDEDLKLFFEKNFQKELRIPKIYEKFMTKFPVISNENEDYQTLSESDHVLKDLSYGVGLRCKDTTIQFGVFYLNEIIYGQKVSREGNDIIEYKGSFKNGLKHGQGLMTNYSHNQSGQFNQQISYKGNFVENQKQGQGIEDMVFQNTPDFFGYEGFFDNNLPHGEGRLYLNREKTRYSIGQFQRGMRTETHSIFENQNLIEQNNYFIVCGKEIQCKCNIM